jgi:hypothetical protein
VKLGATTQEYGHGSCELIAGSTRDRGDLADHITAERAAGVLCCYFGPQTYSVLLRGAH